jgi:hypothetical protein
MPSKRAYIFFRNLVVTQAEKVMSQNLTTQYKFMTGVGALGSPKGRV